MRSIVIGTTSGLAERARRAGIEVFGLAAESGDPGRFREAGIAMIEEGPHLFERLEPPRVYLLDLGAGAGMEERLDARTRFIEPGDVLVDFGPSWWCDTLRRSRRLRHRALYLVDACELATPGPGALLASGDPEALRIALPVLSALAHPARPLLVGSSGAAHYVGMIADAVETAVRQAHDEALQMIEAWPGSIDPEALRGLWPAPSGEDPRRDLWLLDDAVRLEAAVPLLAQAVMLAMATRLEEMRSAPAPLRLGSFLRPDEPEE